MAFNEMDKLEKLVEEYDSGKYSVLPTFMKRRVDALKKIQIEQIKLQHQYNKRLQELELEFDKLYQPLYQKRAKIVSGEHEPTDEECKLPEGLSEPHSVNGVMGHDEDIPAEYKEAMHKELGKLTAEEEEKLKDKVKGLPGFWLGCLASTYTFNDSIEDHDRQVLRYLKDIQLVYTKNGEDLVYRLDFIFDENPHFTNRVLTKTYYLKSNPEENNIFAYEGFEVYKSEGCQIDWKPGKDITVKTVTVKQQNKNNGKTREKKKEVERDSFFYFFKPPQVPEGTSVDDIDEELGAIMSVDFELGEQIRQTVIPKAVLHYTGYLEDDDDDDDDETDSDDDSDDYDSEDLEESDAESRESDGLIKKNA